MKVGEVIICINDSAYEYITNDNKYVVVDNLDPQRIVIINNGGRRSSLYRNRFISLEEQRNNRLLEIGI